MTTTIGRTRPTWKYRHLKKNLSFKYFEFGNQLEQHKENFLYVRFEDGAIDPEKFEKRLLNFVGLDGSNIFEPRSENEKLNDYQKQTNGRYNAKVEDRNASSVLNSWKNKISEEDQIKIERNCKELLLQFGYKTENN